MFSDAEKNWRRFGLGLGGFVCSAVLLLLVAEYHVVLYVLSLTLLFASFGLAMFGYAGIFVQRMRSLQNAKRYTKHFDD